VNGLLKDKDFRGIATALEALTKGVHHASGHSLERLATFKCTFIVTILSELAREGTRRRRHMASASKVR